MVDVFFLVSDKRLVLSFQALFAMSMVASPNRTTCCIAITWQIICNLPAPNLRKNGVISSNWSYIFPAFEVIYISGKLIMAALI